MSKISLDRCNCVCHTPGVRAMHIVPCCHSCEFCGEDRIIGIHQHQEKCERNPKNGGTPITFQEKMDDMAIKSKYLGR